MMQMEEQEESVRGETGRVKREKVYEELKPYIYCIFSNFCFAGYSIISKIALEKSMSRYVLVVYGHAFGTLATALLAFLFERLINPSISLFFFGILLDDSIVTSSACLLEHVNESRKPKCS
jgi:hypothetical protein